MPAIDVKSEQMLANSTLAASLDKLIKVTHNLGYDVSVEFNPISAILPSQDIESGHTCKVANIDSLHVDIDAALKDLSSLSDSLNLGFHAEFKLPSDWNEIEQKPETAPAAPASVFLCFVRPCPNGKPAGCYIVC